MKCTKCVYYDMGLCTKKKQLVLDFRFKEASIFAMKCGEFRKK